MGACLSKAIRSNENLRLPHPVVEEGLPGDRGPALALGQDLMVQDDLADESAETM